MWVLLAGNYDHLEAFLNNKLHLTHKIHCQFNKEDYCLLLLSRELQNILFRPEG